MEHPPKQGLKRKWVYRSKTQWKRFNGTSTKTRIETHNKRFHDFVKIVF